MNKKDIFAAFIAVIALAGTVQSIYDPRAVDERNYEHGNNFIDDDAPKTECPNDFTGQIAYAMDCRQFLNCYRGHGSIQSCPPGTMFNPRNRECDHPSKVKCKRFEGFTRQTRNPYNRSQRQQAIQCESGASGLFAHPYDCTKFLNCDHGRTFIQDCGPGTMFNDIFKVCDWPHKVDCGARSATGEQDFSESRREEVNYGEGQMDVRSNFGTEQIPTNRRNYPVHEPNGRGFPAQEPSRQAYPTYEPNRQGFPAQESNRQGYPRYEPNRQGFPAQDPSRQGYPTYEPNRQGYPAHEPNRQGFPAHDIRNQQRYPDAGPHQSNANHDHGINSQSSNSYPSIKTVNANPSPSFNSPNAFDSTLEIPEQNHIKETSVDGKIDLNELGSDDKFAQEYDSLAQSNGRTGRVDDTLIGNPNFVTPQQPIDSNRLDPIDNGQQPQLNLRERYPDVYYMSPRVAADFDKYFTNPKPKSEFIPTTTSTTTPKNVVMLDGEPVTMKVKTIYPSGFEDLGSKCDETGTGLNEHPHDCTKFVTCENGRMRVQSCDVGFMFNPMLKICDFSRNVQNCKTGIREPTIPAEQDALNEIHNDDRIEKTTPPNQETYPRPYFIPDMSVLPLATHSPASYYPQEPSTTEPYSYSGFGRPSLGGDIGSETIDDIHRRFDDERIEPTTLREGKGIQFETTTAKQNVMKIPVGKEHVMPIYQRPTRPSSLATTTTTTTTKRPSPLENYNHVYYQPFAKPPNDTEPETDYIPISEALKLLLRPYITRNDTKAENKTNMGNIENKLLDMFDEGNNVKTARNKSFEQDDLASALLNENVAVQNLPVVTPKPENRLDVESVPLNHVENNEKHVPSPVHHPNHHKPLFHGSHSPNPHNFKHSPEFHKNHPHINPNYNKQPSNNQIIFPGPPHHYHHMHANSGSHPLPNHNSPPPSHFHHGHHPPHWHEQTTPNTASAPSPQLHQERPTTALRFGRVESDSVANCDGQFKCGNGKCIQLSQLCDGRNDCGNRYDELNCPRVNYQVRLSNDKGHKHMGRVEVRAYGRWGYVCDDRFTMTNADVLCRELGFNMGAAEVKPNSFYPPNANMPAGDTIFTMDEVNCQGNETSLKECDFDGWGVSDCNAEEVVGVVCKVTVMQCPPNHWLCQTSEECIPMSFMCDGLKDCTDGTDESEMHCKAKIEYRLMDGNNELEGRVEVKYRGVWGTVCDDDFGEREANVFCKSLGFDGPATVVPKKYGMSAGPIWLDQVSCLGNETTLDRCMHFEWSESNCNHTEDVSVRCTYGSDAKSSRYIADEYALQHLTNTESSDYLRNTRSKIIPIPDYSNQCGKVKVTDIDDSGEQIGQFRVISGARTKRGYHPWQATIRARGRNGRSSHWCGAVVISKNHILTAAHCLIGFPKGAYFIRLGDHHSEVYENTEVEIFIENWSIHEDFRKDQLMNNDIAVIQLKSPIQFTNYIQPICLPTKETRYEPGKNCTISGWGSIQYGKSTPSLDLKAASVPLIAQDICRQKEIYGEDIMDTMFCAGYLDHAGVDACDGDSGGPLVCASEDGVNELYGIISWGQRCGDSTKPGVYVKVTQYLDWIKDKMNQMR